MVATSQQLKIMKTSIARLNVLLPITLLDDFSDLIIIPLSPSLAPRQCPRKDLEIAIKVKHPNIEKDLENQKELIKFIKFIQYIPYFKNKYNLYFNIDDFLSDINLQCDFNNEANNCKTFQDNFKESSTHIIFPKILYQSNDMIISEFIEGDSFNNLTDIQKYQTSINFICFFYQMLFVDNFIHGDLHCKNWKVRLNKETNIIQIIV